MKEHRDVGFKKALVAMVRQCIPVLSKVSDLGQEKDGGWRMEILKLRPSEMAVDEQDS